MVSSGYEGVGNQRFIGFRNQTKEMGWMDTNLLFFCSSYCSAALFSYLYHMIMSKNA